MKCLKVLMPRPTTLPMSSKMLLRPAGHAHMQRIVRRRLPLGFRFPIVKRCHHAGRSGNDEVDDQRGAAGERGEGAALPGLGRRRAHERHFEMGMRVDAARDDVGAFRVERFAALQILADRGDLLALDQDIGLVGPVGGDDGAALDHCRHGCSPFECSALSGLVDIRPLAAAPRPCARRSAGKPQVPCAWRN